MHEYKVAFKVTMYKWKHNRVELAAYNCLYILYVMSSILGHTYLQQETGAAR